MKRILRKVASIFVATAMVAALGVSAMATELPEEGVTGDKNPATALETTLVIQKDLKVYNPSADEVYGPGVSYTYTIGAGSAEKEITDVDGVKALTKAGVGTPTITGSVAYPNNEKVDAAPAGASNLKPIEINFANVTFPGAGVYRYVVTETCSNKADVGVVGDNATETVRYLDVYVRDPKDGETGYKIYGYVLFAVDDDIDGSTAASNNLDDVVKTQGFVDTTTGSGSGAATLKADAYYTYNLEVKKTLVNDAANNDHGFPFTLTFTKPDGVSGNFNLISSDGFPDALRNDSVCGEHGDGSFGDNPFRYDPAGQSRTNDDRFLPGVEGSTAGRCGTARGGTAQGEHYRTERRDPGDGFPESFRRNTAFRRKHFGRGTDAPTDLGFSDD